jgi:uncharacterized protein (TIGR02687 family)
MTDRIVQTLGKLFDRHRIVFWYDAKKELRADFEALSLPGIEKLEIKNNEYGLKYRMLREQPGQKFLFYHEGPQPADLDNWLLDVQLAHGEFRTDQAALWLSELELGLEFSDIVQEHSEFFKAVKRKEALKRMLKSDDTRSRIQLKMLAVCAGSEPRLDSVLESLLDEAVSKDAGNQSGYLFEMNGDQGSDKMKFIKRCNLEAYLWEQMKRQYGYQSSDAGIKDFAIQIFSDCYFQNFPVDRPQAKYQLTSDAVVFLKRWKDSRQFESSFETLSGECADVLNIEQDLAGRDFRDLIEMDYFRLIDQKIISDLVKELLAKTVSSDDISRWIRRRRQTHWYQDFKHLYEAIDYAGQFITTLDQLSIVSTQWPENESESTQWSPAAWIERYTKSWYMIDQLYRKFIYHVRMSGQTSLMGSLTDHVENLYSNKFLLRVNDRWQAVVGKMDKWAAPPIPLQKDFFADWVEPFLEKDKKVCVIISDAMRYEIGAELQRLIRKEDRFGAELQASLSMLPSYTQLGMAALLPNSALTIADNESGTVLVDGLSSQGTANRIKILDKALPQRATAVKVEELMALKGDECRKLIRDHDVIYVYHNRIDSIGDKRDSEEKVFEAAEETLQELVRVIKKLTAANANNLLVTSDHGFIYQNHVIDESDFVGIFDFESEIDDFETNQKSAIKNQKYLYRDRRFVLGKNLQDHPSLKKFTASELGLFGDVEVQIPKSINRLRLRGSGSRFVHGGASLQEVVIPVVKINKKRYSDVSAVEVEILRGGSSVITAGQVAVVFYQAQPATDKVQPRILRAGIYTEAGELISDVHDLAFDLASDNPRDRELPIRFILTAKADEANGQEVILKLEEKHAGTSHYKEYKSIRYLMRRSFTSDFDF